MRRDSRAITSADEGGLAPLPPAPPGLEELVAAVRAAVSRPADWQGTAELVSQELARHLPSSDVLGPEQRIGDPDGHRSHLLYSEPGGTFFDRRPRLAPWAGDADPRSRHLVCVRSRPGRGARGADLLDEERGCLVAAGARTNREGDVSGFAPPGDIHRVRNVGHRTAISLHVNGTDVSRVGSSVRRPYDQPRRLNGGSAAAHRFARLSLEPRHREP